MQRLPILNRYMPQNVLTTRIRSELERSMIPIVESSEPSADLRASFYGQLGSFVFDRRSDWWAVQGIVPMELAMLIYADPVGKTDISASQHSNPKDPRQVAEELGGQKYIMSYRINTEIGLRVFADKLRAWPGLLARDKQ